MHKKHYLILIALSCVASFELFYGLSLNNLWQDEAETAHLGLSLLNGFIFPNAFGSNTIVTQGSFIEFTSTGTWSWSPWLMHYVSAWSMSLFGRTNFGARTLFVVAGIATLIVLYIYLVRETQHKTVVGTIALLLLLSDPDIIIHFRQCRYYSLAAFFSFVLFWGFEIYPRKIGFLLIIISTVFLFHTNYAFCGLCFLSFCIYHCSKLYHGSWRKFVLLIATVSLFTIPWFFYFDISRVFGQQISHYGKPRTVESIRNSLSLLSHFFIPAVILLLTNRQNREPILIIILVLISSIGISISTDPYPRHYIHLWPICTAVLLKSLDASFSCRTIRFRYLSLMSCLIAFCISSNFYFRMDVVKLIKSFSSKRDTPISGLTDYFRSYPDSLQIVMPYGHMSLAFQIEGSVFPAVKESLVHPISEWTRMKLPSISDIDFVVMRHSWNHLQNFRQISEKLIDRSRCSLMLTQIPDFAWEQRENIRSYNFNSAASNTDPKIKIIKIQDSSGDRIRPQ